LNIQKVDIGLSGRRRAGHRQKGLDVAARLATFISSGSFEAWSAKQGATFRAGSHSQVIVFAQPDSDDSGRLGKRSARLTF